MKIERALQVIMIIFLTVFITIADETSAILRFVDALCLVYWSMTAGYDIGKGKKEEY